MLRTWRSFDALRMEGGAALAELVGLTNRASKPTIGRPRRAAVKLPGSPLDGLSDDQLVALTGLNALKNAEAAVNLAGVRLTAVVPLVDSEARKLGMLIDWNTPEAHPVLLECLRAYRSAWGDVVRRDAGKVLPTAPSVRVAALCTPARPMFTHGRERGDLERLARVRSEGFTGVMSCKPANDALPQPKREHSRPSSGEYTTTGSTLAVGLGVQKNLYSPSWAASGAPVNAAGAGMAVAPACRRPP